MEPCRRLKERRYSSPASFAGAVGRHRAERGVLGRGLVALAVDRAARGAEDDLRPVACGGLEHPHRPEHVHRRVLDRMLDGDADVRLRSEVEHRLRTQFVEHVVERLADVADLELGALGDVLALARHERVDDDDLVPACEEGVRHVRADEPGAPCHDDPHGRILWSHAAAVGWARRCSSPSKASTGRARRPRPSSCGRGSRRTGKRSWRRASRAGPSWARRSATSSSTAATSRRGRRRCCTRRRARSTWRRSSRRRSSVASRSSATGTWTPPSPIRGSRAVSA